MHASLVTAGHYPGFVLVTLTCPLVNQPHSFFFLDKFCASRFTCPLEPVWPQAQHHSAAQFEHEMCMHPLSRCVRAPHEGQGRVCSSRNCASGVCCSKAYHATRSAHEAGK